MAASERDMAIGILRGKSHKSERAERGENEEEQEEIRVEEIRREIGRVKGASANSSLISECLQPIRGLRYLKRVSFT